MRKTLLITLIAVLLVSSAIYFSWNALLRHEPDVELGRSIAVLPFTDMSPSQDQGYLGDGLAEEIINSLSHIPGLQISGRTSSFGYRDRRNMDLKQIGKELGVNTILEGSVQKSGNILRITVQLIKTKDGYHLWSEHYDREMKDLFLIQDEIARTITERLRLTFGESWQAARDRARKTNPQAYEMFLKGMYYLNGDQTEFQKAIPYFEHAIHIDSTYALAYAMLGYTYARMGWWDVITPRDAFEKMHAMAQKSIALDPELAIGYAVLASAQLHGYYDWNYAKKYFEKSLELDSLNSVALNEYAYFNLYSGNYEKALQLAEKNLARDPTNSFYLIDIANIYYHAHKPEQAQETYQKIRELSPEKVDGYFEQFRFFGNQLQFDSAHYYYQKAVERGLREKTKFTLFEAKRLVKDGKQDEAHALFDKNKSEVKAMDKAIIYALFNMTDEMMESLEISYLERDDDLLNIRTMKDFSRFSAEPGFLKFVAKLNFPGN